MLRWVWRRYIKDTPAERPLRRAVALGLGESKAVRKNRADDWALIDLISDLPKNACCVDVGASAGHILRSIVMACPKGVHYAFEPLPERAAALRSTYPEVRVQECALSDHSGTETFTHVRGRDTRSGLSATISSGLDASAVEMTVQVSTLDEALETAYAPALIKIDVEGGELAVLQGARRTLASFRPVVALEHATPDFDATRSTEVYEELAQLGYQWSTASGQAIPTLSAFLALVKSGRDWNFIARHGGTTT